MKNMLTNLHLRRGFTLIELMIVIVILGVLMGTILPRLTGAQGRARDTGRIADLQSIAQALEVYANDNAGLYPGTLNTIECLDPAGAATTSAYKIGQYMKGKKVPVPPANTASGTCTGTNSGKYYYKPVLRSGATGTTGYVLMSDVETFQMANAHWAAGTTANSAATDQDSLTFLTAPLTTEAKLGAPTSAAPEGTGAVTPTNSVYIVQ